MDENSNYLPEYDDSPSKKKQSEMESSCPDHNTEEATAEVTDSGEVDNEESNEAFDCDVKDINGNSADQPSLEKLAETTAAMNDLSISTDADDLYDYRQLPPASLHRNREAAATSLENHVTFKPQRHSMSNVEGSQYWASSKLELDPTLALSTEVSSLTMKQQQQLYAQLQDVMMRQNQGLSSSSSHSLHPSSPGSRLSVTSSEEREKLAASVGELSPPARHRRRTAYVWNGELPPRNYSHPLFSCKIFVGGVPWDITEPALIEAFAPYGHCRVEWPGKEARYSRTQARNAPPRGKITGYVYMIFDQERSVKALLQDCSQEFGSAGEWYFKLKARRNLTTEIRQVQIIPWVVSDASYVEDPGCRLDPKKTVFVGALHGMITAHVLFSIMDELYGNVVFVGIDTDKYKYPIGSGRVTFRSHNSYFRAIESAFLEIKTSKFGKKVQIDPFLEDSACMMCEDQAGPYFCRDRACFRYFCEQCWKTRHSSCVSFNDHRPLMRNAPRFPSAQEEAEMAAIHHQLMAYGGSGPYGHHNPHHSHSTFNSRMPPPPRYTASVSGNGVTHFHDLQKPSMHQQQMPFANPYGNYLGNNRRRLY